MNSTFMQGTTSEHYFQNYYPINESGKYKGSRGAY